MKIIEVIADVSYQDIITTIADQHEVHDCWLGPKGEDGRRVIRLILGDEKRQEVLDALQGALSNSTKSKIVVIAVEALLPRVETNGGKTSKIEKSGATTREELYNNIEKNARLNGTYLILVVLSTHRGRHRPAQRLGRGDSGGHPAAPQATMGLMLGAGKYQLAVWGGQACCWR